MNLPVPAEQRLRQITDTISEVFWIADPGPGRLLYVSPAYEHIWGRSCRELYERPEVLAESIHPDDRARVLAARSPDADGAAYEQEYRILRPDGSLRWIWDRGRPVYEDSQLVRFVGVATDITERKRAEQALSYSEQRFRALIEDAAEAIAVVDAGGAIQYVSPAIRTLGGYAPAELVGQSFLAFVHPDDQAAAARTMKDLQARPGGESRQEFRYRDGHGAWRHVESVARNLLGQQPVDGIVVNLRDVTARSRAERALRTLSAGSAALIHAQDEAALYREMCRIVVGVGGYRMAWIGQPQQDAAKRVRPLHFDGHVDGFFEQANICWDDGVQGQAPTGRAIRLGTVQIVRDLAADPDLAPWRAASAQRGYASVLACPLRDGDRVIGSFSIVSAERDAFDAAELALLTELAQQLAFGVAGLRARLRHEESGRRLTRSMESTVFALASMAEKRDPYTAGHQRNVAGLAHAIGQALQLSPQRLQGLRLAAMIHDIGKINVPAEILAKPGKVSALEMALIREHAQAGYEILKDVDFPWPIAEMVRQHHERIDGSGYPRGLKGEDILLEARIIAVADVFEALHSHRPYRPARGLAAARQELLDARGTTLDAAAVDACLELVRQGYTFAP